MIQRHQDYQLTLATVPVGGLIGVQLKLDSDAEFAARLVRTRGLGTRGFRFRTPRGLYQSNDFRTDLTLDGQPTRGLVIYPELVYPANGAILLDVPNETTNPLTNVKILFRGSKRYRDGAIASPSYPDKCRVPPFTYPLVIQNIPEVVNPGDLANIVVPPSLVGGTASGVNPDADFALRYGFASAFRMQIDGVAGAAGVSGTYNQLYVTLRDEWYQPFSNEPIHIDDLFGSPTTTATGSIDCGYRPNLFTPEIYVRRTRSLYMDIIRNDPGLGVIDLHFAFGGARVLPA